MQRLLLNFGEAYHISNLNYLFKIPKMTILILAGFSLGYEYALDIFKFDEFRWMFSALLGTGLISYLILTRMRIFSNSSWKALRFILGVFFVGMGLIVVLLT